MLIRRFVARKLPSWFWPDVILPFAATRVALCVIAWLGFRLLPLPSAFPLSWEVGTDGAHHATRNGAPGAHPFINMWSRWDSGWYLEIAKFGYHYEPTKPSSTAFFPVYPLVTRWLHAVLFLPDSDYWYLVAAVTVSNTCLVAAATYMRRLVRLDYGGHAAAGATLCLFLFPTSFFLSAAYSESMFLLLTISSFYYARKNYWFIASLLAALAISCRSLGIILVVPLLVEYLVQCKFKLRSVRWNLAALLLVPAALALFVLYLRLAFGSWTILFDSQQPWGRRFLAPWYTFGWVLTHASGHDWLDFSFLILLAVTMMFGARQLRASYAVYLLTAMAFFSCWGMLGSVPRFVVVIFPVFIVLALMSQRSPTLRAIYFTVSSILAVILFFMHSQWNWVA